MALTDSIVAFWKLSDLSDSVASYTLTNINTATFVAGLVGNCVRLVRSSSQSLSTTDTLGINGGTASVSFWIKPATLPSASGVHTCFYQNNQSNDVGIRIYLYNDAGTQQVIIARLRDNIAENRVTTNTTLSTSAWTHIVYTYSGATVTGYINGSSVGTVASSGNGSASVIANGVGIGSNPGGGGGTFDGDIDACGVWSRELTSAEVTSLYASGAGLEYPFTVGSASNSQFTGMGI